MKRWPRGWHWKLALTLAVGVVCSLSLSALAQDKPAEKPAEKAAEAKPAEAKPEEVKQEAKVFKKEEVAKAAEEAMKDHKVLLDTLWTIVAGFLVFFMNLGFACVETGLCRAKNAVNILSKNFIVFAASTLGFWFIGWGLMFGDGNAFMGTQGLFFVGGEDFSPLTGDALNIGEATPAGVYDAIGWSTTPLWTKFFFQLVFCATAATIVSGCVAERIKYVSFILFSVFISIAIYPIVGHWIWGGGFLGAPGEGKTGFLDFAGSTQVHSIGGWAGLAGILVLGPRLGKFTADGKVAPIPGHSMALATIGCFILWLGWFGFNPGSTMGADAGAISLIVNTTNMAAMAATLTATITTWLIMGKPDLGMTLNGALAGLVAITAPCAWVSVGSSVVIGAIAGVLVVLAVLFWDKMKIDDPVGALSVHLVNGVFGTICVGLFHKDAGLFMGGGAAQLMAQLKGVAVTALYVFPMALVGWFALKATLGIRVSKEEEIQGLDLGEHGQEAYPGFQMLQGK